MTKNIILPFPPRKTDGDTWQVGYVRFPGWTDDQDPPYRPRLAIAVSAETGLIGSSDLVHPTDVGPELALSAMDSLAEVMGRRPAKIEVSEPALADALATSTEDERVIVECRPDLPLMAEPLREMYREIAREEPFDAATAVPGVTLDLLRAFAEAAAVFHDAAPWRLLDSNDIIEVEAPRPAPNVRYACVLNAQGERGLAFSGERSLMEPNETDEEEGFARLADDSVWSVTYFVPWELPIIEHDLWLDEGLPTDPGGRIPAAVQFGPKRRVRRASPKMLGFFEGCFRALAETTEDELDSGEWRKLVETSQGKLSLGLSLPDILSPPAPAAGEVPPFNPLRSAAMMDGIRDLLAGQTFESEEDMRVFLENEVMGKELPPPPNEGPEDVARDLAIDAMDTPGRRGVALARQALKIDPDSSIAHLALALHTRDPKTAIERFRQAVAMAERALDPNRFIEDVGSFWLISETRPYMEAVKGLADALWLDGQRREAVEHYAELIRLNPNDNQGIRDRLAPALLAVGDDEAAEELLDRYADDITAAHQYNRALASFRRKGKAKASKKRLDEAIETNPDVPDLLLGRLDPPSVLPDTYAIGSIEEAVFYFLEAEEVWRETPGALDWLSSALDTD